MQASDELTAVAETEEAQGEEDGSRAMTMLWLGYARRDAGEPGDAVMAWTEGHELAQAGGDFALAARVGKELGLLMMQFDDEDAVEVLDDAVEDVVGSGSALIDVAQALLTTERYEEALAVLADAAPRVTEVPRLSVRVALMEGDAHEALGRHDAAAAARARVDG